MWASGPRKAGKILRGRASFPPQDFPCFPRMLCIRDGGSFRRLNRRKSAQRTLLVSPDLTADEIPATGGHRRFVRARSHNVTKLAILPINSVRLFSRQTNQHPPMRVQGDHPPGQVWAESPAFPLCWPCNCYIFTLHTDAVKSIRRSSIPNRRAGAGRNRSRSSSYPET